MKIANFFRLVFKAEWTKVDKFGRNTAPSLGHFVLDSRQTAAI